ncbi:MAG: hypothetical protein FJ288_04330 [Planctomycetes bacterium]|nr:hypothetical protein [Planctomycetota bacterium]
MIRLPFMGHFAIVLLVLSPMLSGGGGDTCAPPQSASAEMTVGGDCCCGPACQCCAVSAPPTTPVPADAKARQSCSMHCECAGSQFAARAQAADERSAIEPPSPAPDAAPAVYLLTRHFRK